MKCIIAQLYNLVVIYMINIMNTGFRYRKALMRYGVKNPCQSAELKLIGFDLISFQCRKACFTAC